MAVRVTLSSAIRPVEGLDFLQRWVLIDPLEGGDFLGEVLWAEQGQSVLADLVSPLPREAISVRFEPVGDSGAHFRHPTLPLALSQIDTRDLASEKWPNSHLNAGMLLFGPNLGLGIETAELGARLLGCVHAAGTVFQAAEDDLNAISAAVALNGFSSGNYCDVMVLLSRGLDEDWSRSFAEKFRGDVLTFEEVGEAVRARAGGTWSSLTFPGI